MSQVTRSLIPRELIENVIESVIDQIEYNTLDVDEIDINKVKNADGIVLRSILTYMDENVLFERNNNLLDDEVIDKISSNIIDTLKWRKEYGLNDIKCNDFPTAFFKHKYIEVCKKYLDDGTVIMVKNECKHEKVSSEWNKIVERFMIYFTEHITSQYFNNGKDVIYLMNFTDFGYKHIDTNFSINFYDLIGKYYPRLTIENTAIDMPWYAKPAMKLVVKILPPSVAKIFKLMNRKELINQFGEKYVPTSLSGMNELYQPFDCNPLIQKNFVSIQEIGIKNGIPQNDIDKMISIFGAE